jgi:protein-S-isoprenylcysteine O-methyltransferase Ste14
MKLAGVRATLRTLAARGGIVVFFIMAFEVMIMISPFAFFFYSVFNPVFQWCDQYPATQWLTGFFLPHMILPPTLLLQGLRVLGSVLFVLGLAAFVVCALQVYLGKIFKWGVATRGFYRYVRHPQYLALGIWGVGMSILWPRFIVLATLAVMFLLYDFLARDEERRMLAQFGEAYARYQRATGRFVPRAMEGPFTRVVHLLPARAGRRVALPFLTVAAVLGAGFLCRSVTLRSLPFASEQNVTLVPILPEDRALSAGVLHGLLHSAAARSNPAKALAADKDYLGYVMPVDYIMQGMIADTGGESHLFKHHQTFGMISDWVLHPFAHLRRPPSAHMAKLHHVDPAVARRHHCPLGLDDPSMACSTCPYRRVILVEIEHTGAGHASGSALLAFGAVRVPFEAIDINTATGEIIKVTKVGRATAWRDVPTPAI